MKRTLTVIGLLVSTAAFAQAPALLGYQGRLLKSDGTPETGSVGIKFSFYGAETGGTALWEETQTLSLNAGFYSTHIGKVMPLQPSVFDSGNVFLELAVRAQGDTDFRAMTPRQRVGSVAYALNARSLSGGAVNASSISVNNVQVFDSQGRLTAAAGYSAGPGISIDSTSRSISLNASGCTNGQVLAVNGTSWSCVTPGSNYTAGPGLTVDNTARTIGLSTSGCSNGQVLQFNGSSWACGTISGGAGGTVTSVTGTAPISVTNNTTTPVISVAVGTAAGTVAAGDDSRFGNASTLQGRPVSNTGPSTNQVLAWNGSAWAPAAPPSGGGGAGTGGLIANFEFEEATGNTFNDTSGLNNNATFTSGLTAGAVGHTGVGANFSGGVATVAMGNTLPDSPQVFVEAWIWPQSVSMTGQGVIAAKSGAWSFRYRTGPSISDLDFTVTTRAASPTCTTATTGAAIPTTTWSHVEAFYDGLNVAIAINGRVVARAACAKGALASSTGTPLTIGGAASGERYLGFLDSLRIRSFAQIPQTDIFPDNPFPGSTILTRAQMDQLNLWTGRPFNRWALCFRKSTASATTAAAFHAACDYRGPTMTIIKTATRVFGGYSRLSWHSSNLYSYYDSSAFLFSLTSNKRYNTMGYSAAAYPATIYAHASYGPTFGNGHDIYVNGTLDIGYCNFPYSYNCNQRGAGSPNDTCSQELCGVNASSGAATATIQELEVWYEE